MYYSMYKRYVYMPLWIISCTAWSLRSSIFFSFFLFSLIGQILWILSVYSTPTFPYFISHSTWSQFVNPEDECRISFRNVCVSPQSHKALNYLNYAQIGSLKVYRVACNDALLPYVPYIDWWPFKTDTSFRSPHRPAQTIWDLENSVVMKIGVTVPYWLHISSSYPLRHGDARWRSG